jgi:hypothetical protein
VNEGVGVGVGVGSADVPIASDDDTASMRPTYLSTALAGAGWAGRARSSDVLVFDHVVGDVRG